MEQPKSGARINKRSVLRKYQPINNWAACFLISGYQISSTLSGGSFKLLILASRKLELDSQGLYLLGLEISGLVILLHSEPAIKFDR